MGIIVVEHNDINVKIVRLYSYGNTKKKEKSPKNKNKSKIMDCYAEGMGLNALCRVFKVGINSIQSWIKQEGEKFIQPDIKEEKFVSCDEMWTFVEKKKQKAWIWLCYSKMTSVVVNFKLLQCQTS